ncbi:MAG: hypothetical protein IPK29_12370 [Betaproteobacteria bacterium]|jgi:hypothetical protein|nr:hypothetical protein [Betaproteobacteria bacterium]
MKNLAFAVLLACLAGCGDKVPESEAARKVGAAPKQAMDNTVNSATRALEQGENKNRDAVDKAEK